MKFFGFLVLSGMVLLSACSKDEEDKTPTFTATAKVALANATSTTNLLDSVPLTVFGMKIVRVYASEDIDPVTGGNTGQNFMVYMHPECVDDQKTCDLSGAEQNVSAYFDLARPSAQVNADLNAQNRTMVFYEAAGSREDPNATPVPESVILRYARIEMSGANPDKAKNLKWATADIPARELLWEGTATTKLATPIVVKQGDTITFTLSYDYSEAVRTVQNPPADNDCVTSPSTAGSYDCFFNPQFVSSAAKN